MPKVSDYTRTRIEVLDKQGLPPVAILRSLKNEGLSVSLASVTRIVKKLQALWQIYRVLEDLKSCHRRQKLSLISKCKKMMRWQAARSRGSWRNTEFQYVQPPCEEWERSLVGLYRRRHIVNSSEPQTRRNDWSTLGVCWKMATPLTMWSSLTNAPFSFSNIAVAATRRSTSRWSASQNRSIRS